MFAKTADLSTTVSNKYITPKKVSVRYQNTRINNLMTFPKNQVKRVKIVEPESTVSLTSEKMVIPTKKEEVKRECISIEQELLDEDLPQITPSFTRINF
jgi:hypothetical protein